MAIDTAPIVSAVLAASRFPNTVISEIDIYCYSGVKCAAQGTSDGAFSNTLDYDRYLVNANQTTATRDATKQTFSLDKRTQVPPDEASIGVRILYTFTSPILGVFSEFTQTLSDYAVMKASSVLV